MNASRFHRFLAIQSIQRKLSYPHHKNNHLLQCNNNIIACKRTLFQQAQTQKRQQYQHQSHTWTKTNHATTAAPAAAAGIQRNATFQQLKSYWWTAAILSSVTVTASALLFYSPYRSAIVDSSIGIQCIQQQQQQQQQQRNLITWTSSYLSSFLHRWGHLFLELQYQQHDPMNRTHCDSGNQPTTTTSSIAPHNPTSTVHYSEDPDYYDTNDTSGYIEEERFYQCVTYHRSLLHDYNRRWSSQNNNRTNNSQETITASPQQQQRRWPRNVPEHADEVSALEFDLQFCENSLRYQQNQNMTTTMTSSNSSSNSISSSLRSCQDTSFRIATYYIFTLQPSTTGTAKNIDNESPNDIDFYKQIKHDKGFRVIKELAEQGYPDAMCLYGVLLNEGTHGVEPNPKQAVVWWRRCVDEHGHINSMYELATACYLGEGIVENAPMAVSLFRRAAHLGHPGAAYMLGECQLNGVGVERDRTDALEWLVTAAELGHRGAQDRVLMILNEDYGTASNKESSDDAKQRQLEETVKWINDEDVQSYDPSIETLHKAVNIERRFTIGGGSRNPVVVARRKTIVAESREEH